MLEHVETKTDSGQPYKENKKKENLQGLDSGDPTLSCKFCSMKSENESSMQNVSSPCATPLISPTISLSSTDSFVSSCSEFSVDANLDGREDGNEGALGFSQESLNLRPITHVENSSFPTLANGSHRSGAISVENLEGSSNGRSTYSLDQGTIKDVHIIGIGDGPERTENNVGSTTQSLSQSLDEPEWHIWIPPDPEDLEDDMEGSVANNDDDDDECSDGTKWVQPCSLSIFSKEGNSSFRFKEERKKAMVEVMNGEFKDLVSGLLASEGIAFSGEPGGNWVEIVTSLSWEAAFLVKPDALQGKAMDPKGFVKVKCIAAGSRSQSQVIKGLVFKKNAAHKHMPTKYKSPRLLLLQGMLGQRSLGLSSFESMEQEMDNLKSVTEMIEMCQPNVVLVEKTVSRDVQESLLAKGITLVFDMKLHRLERIACCTSSQIVSSVDNLINHKLKQCKFFRFEKFEVEHGGYGEGGKKPRKTLMFLEGCSRPLGCTILLKGAPSDELKKIKCVVLSAVLVAYRLILETSFLVDQRAMLCAIHCSDLENGCLTDQQFSIVSSGTLLDPNGSCVNEYPDVITLPRTSDIHTSDGLQNKPVYEGMSFNSHLGLKGNSTPSGSSSNVSLYKNEFGETALVNHSMSDNSNVHQPERSHEPITPTILSGQLLSPLSTSLKKVQGDGFPLVSSTSYQSISTYFGFKEREPDSQDTSILPVVTSPEPLNFCDKQSILFLMSSRNFLRRLVCEETHLSRIKYYRSSDKPLGKFLRDNLFNQGQQCSRCHETPDAHVYSYAHHNGKLTVRVKQLPLELRLPGEAEGKLWMWTRCSKCKLENGIPKFTRRVVMSPASHGLSFGKFLELSFSNHSTFNKLSSCGHSWPRDFLFFYGLGPKVAMFRYSSVDIYAAYIPPQILEFNNPIGHEWLEKEAEDVLRKGMSLFMEVTNLLQKIGSGFSSSLLNRPLKFRGSVKNFAEVEVMLRQEKCDFVDSIQKAFDKNVHLGQAVHKLLSLNRLLCELLLESYVWDRRLRLLLSADSRILNSGTSDKVTCDEQLWLQKDEISDGRINERSISPCSEKIANDFVTARISPVINEASQSSNDYQNAANCGSILETELEIKLEERSTVKHESKVTEVQVSEPVKVDQVLGSQHPNNAVNSCTDAEDNSRPTVGSLNPSGFSSDEWIASTAGRVLQDLFIGQDSSTGPSHLKVDQTIPIATDLLRDAESFSNMVLQGSSPGDNCDKAGYKDLDTGIYLSQDSQSSNLNDSEGQLSNLPDSEGWVWNSFSETRKVYRKDLQRGYSQKFEFINSYTPECLSSVNQLISEEGSRMFIPLGHDDNFVSVYEGELTSIIACGLALLHDQHNSTEDLVETKNEKGEAGKMIENAQSLAWEVSMGSPYWSSNGSLGSEGMHTSSDESYTPISDGLNPVDTLPSSSALHPEIPLGVGKLPGKGKYSVVCLYANEFHALRRRCCPCELDYVASLSRCKNWDAKGGKSKSFFAKTLDDRFIVKEIKKTEFDSFLKFAPDYFKHVNQSFSSGSQTCLAKILGIYQVTIRQTKSGKELKHDLMVMENLTFGRNITRLYDLKGTVHSRYTSAADASGKILLDQNFVDDMHICPVYVSMKTKHRLQRAIWNDTYFLTSINVMDYSLLVGVDTQNHKLVCGIIDYLRQYTWDKQLETWVKASLVVPKNVSPTIISPEEYKKRFRTFMSMYFLSIPDPWSPQRSLCNCKPCGNRNDDSSRSVVKH